MLMPAAPRRVPCRRAVEPEPPLALAGIGLRHRHLGEVAAAAPAVGWVEIHSENFLSAGGPHVAALHRIRQELPVSCHCVGMSLGSAHGVDGAHLAALRRLFDWCEPALVSDHLSWSVTGGAYLNDLLPLPYSEEALQVVCANVDIAQTVLRRRILVENPSTYLRFVASEIPEAEFLAAVAERTGCGILLDVNNIHVSCANSGRDPEAYLAAIPPLAVGEIDVAGHSAEVVGGVPVLIDDHGAPVAPAVWTLLEHALARIGPVPVLVEWDTRVPDLPVLLAEAARADRCLAAISATGGLCDA